MREIVLDTETTGLNPLGGDRIVELGAVELINHLPSGRTWHHYFDPERSMPKEAFDVHGLGDEFLRGKPRFASLAADFLAFIDQAPLIIHNAPFDMGFLNAELVRAGLPPLADARAIDTLAMVKRRYPGAQASLDALCRRFNIDTSARVKHGALLDSELLAEVYLELKGGRQQGLGLDAAQRRPDQPSVNVAASPLPPRPRPLPPRITEAEQAAHTAFVAEIKGALWLP